MRAASGKLSGQLFDFQVNGFGGVDFQRDDLTAAQLRQAVKTLRHHGVAGIFATLITDEVDRLCRRLEKFEQLCAADPEARRMIPGYHLEGPWLNPEPGYRGAHPAAPMHAPEIAEFERLQQAAGGRIKLLTLAPEWPGSADVIAHATAQNVHVSLGHTDASETEIDEAIRAGARFCTHLGNGCPAVLPRHDNIVQRLLARDELTACFIPDGVHLPDFTLRNFVRAKPAGRVLFTTDAMAGAGATPGRYTLGDLEIAIGNDGIARHPGTNTFAGSTLTPDEGVRRIARSLQLSQDEAVRLWSDAPLAAFGLSPISASPRWSPTSSSG
jgi:N-acetylglucosamine-6-phosphate deacetylase